MAIYHLSVQVLGRSFGDKAVAAAAYRGAGRLEDERYEMVHNYTSRKGGLVHSEIMAPEDAPDWVADREALWNAVEAREDQSTRRGNAQVAREIEAALPRELSEEERLALVRRFVEDNLVARGMIADIAIHDRDASDGGRNPHVHILATMRRVTPDGFGLKERAWNDKQLVIDWREIWKVYCNEALEAAGSDARIDNRSLEEQGILRDAGLHMGKEAWNAQAKGEEAVRQQKSAAERAIGPFERRVDDLGGIHVLMTPEAGESWSQRIAAFTQRMTDYAQEWAGRAWETVKSWLPDRGGPDRGPTMER